MVPLFVGRHAECDELGTCLDAALAGRGSIVVISGGAGIGKTALLEEFVRATRLAGTPVLSGRALDDDGAPELWLWTTLLAQPEAADLSLSADMVRPDTLMDGFNPLPAAQFAAMERTAQALMSAAEDRGLLIALDDAHLADAQSVRLLSYLGQSIAASRLLVVVAIRDEAAAPPALGRLLDRSEPNRVTLTGLDPGGIGEYLDRAVGPDVHASWTRFVVAQSGGNALHVRELVRLLGRAALHGDPAMLSEIPPDLRRLLDLRLGGLSAGCRQLLGLCSVVGDTFDPALVETVAAPVLAEPVQELLVEAVAAGLLTEVPDMAWRLRFVHTLYRLARYEALDRGERLDWHRRVADLLQLDMTAAGVSGEVARHRVLAAGDEAGCAVAVAACRIAAHDAGRRNAYEEALRWYDEGLRLASGAQLGATQTAELQIERAGFAYRLGQIGRAVELSVEAAATARLAGRADLLADAALIVRGIGGPSAVVIAELCTEALAELPDREVERRAKLLAQQARTVVLQGRTAWADELSRQALALAEEGSDPAALSDALHARQQILSLGNGLAERRLLIIRMVQLANTESRPDVMLWARIWQLQLALETGDTTELDAQLAAVELAVDRLGWPMGRWHLLRGKAARALLAGAFELAEQLALAARDVAERAEDPSAVAPYFGFMLQVQVLTGRFGEHDVDAWQLSTRYDMPIANAQAALTLAIAGERDRAEILFERVRPVLRTLPRYGPWLPTVVYTAEVAVLLGDADTAAWSYGQLLPYAGLFLNSTAGCGGAIDRTLGIVASHLGQHDDAERHLGEAVAMEQRARSRPHLALAYQVYADALERRGHPDDRLRAVELANRARLIAAPLGMANVTAQAGRLIERLSGSVVPERPPLRYTLLGRVSVQVGDQVHRLPPLTAALLARLVLARGGLVPVDELYRDIWPDPKRKIDRPERIAVQKRINELRKLLEPDRPHPASSLLRTDTAGPTAYQLHVEPTQVDAFRFEQLVNESAEGTADGAVALLREALDSWHDVPLLGLDGLRFAAHAAERLIVLRRAATRYLAVAYHRRGEGARARALVAELLAETPEDPALRDAERAILP